MTRPGSQLGASAYITVQPRPSMQAANARRYVSVVTAWAACLFVFDPRRPGRFKRPSWLLVEPKLWRWHVVSRLPC